jgi:molecular chaperone IbpA|tara:strand:+ start:421 stop:846 length:426 start_codon:yes stop_codon:yes gene_type:complete
MNIINWESYKPFAAYAVGFDSILSRLAEITIDKPESPNYPPYNIRKIDDLKYSIDLALAGFGKKDISVDYADNSLTIKSIKDESKKDDIVHRGISHRSFTRTFALSDDVIVNDAKFENGLLSIELEKIVPEEKRPKEIKIK